MEPRSVPSRALRYCFQAAGNTSLAIRPGSHGGTRRSTLGRGLEPINTGAKQMSKGMDRKKEAKKKPAQTLMQKRAAKAEKKKRK